MSCFRPLFILLDQCNLSSPTNGHNSQPVEYQARKCHSRSDLGYREVQSIPHPVPGVRVCQQNGLRDIHVKNELRMFHLAAVPSSKFQLQPALDLVMRITSDTAGLIKKQFWSSSRPLNSGTKAVILSRVCVESPISCCGESKRRLSLRVLSA